MTDKKIKLVRIFNVFNVVVTFAALILECMPNSVRYIIGTVSVNGEKIRYWSYFGNPTNWLFLVTVIIAALTIFNLIFNIIILFKDKKCLRIVSAILSFLALAGSIILLVAEGKYVTAYNIIIAILFLIELISHGVLFKVTNG